MINVPYRAATFVGRRNRRFFIEHLHRLPEVTPSRRVAVTVYALSCERDWPEQTASIRSFLRFVGLPERFIVISDGSHTDESRKLLESLSPCISVISLSAITRADLPARVQQYAKQHFLGKKLSMLLSLPVQSATIYCDSDVLFFPGAHALAEYFDNPLPGPLYLLDCWPSLDPRLIRVETEKLSPVNAGFLILDRQLNWTSALQRLEQLEGECEFFTEQTLVHLAMKASGGQSLPDKQFVMRAEDQFSYSDYYAGREIVLRHYISSIRTKFWHRREVFS